METTNGNNGRFDGTKAGPGATPGVPQVKRSRGHIDMEHVYKTEKDRNEAHPTDTPGQATCRLMLREDRGKFLTMLNKMRQDFQVRKDRVKKEAGIKPVGAIDEGSRGVIELIDQLLGEWEESRG